MRLDDLERLAADRAGRTEERDPLHEASVGARRRAAGAVGACARITTRSAMSLDSEGWCPESLEIPDQENLRSDFPSAINVCA